MSVNKPHCGGRWSAARYLTFIKNGIRRLTLKWAPRSDAKKAARRQYMGDDKRTKWCYQCAICKQYFKDKDIELDHNIPLGRLNGLEDLPRYISIALSEIDNWQVLCKPCHLAKTNKGIM